MSLRVPSSSVNGKCFPRVSGDEPRDGSIGWGIQWFSPRERG